MAAQDQDQARLRRKLNSPQRLKMAILAVERFRRPDLREIEAAAKAKTTALLYRDATAIPKKEIEVLRKHCFTSDVIGIEGPGKLAYREVGEQREFTLPDGTSVKREDKGKLVIAHCPNSEDDDLPQFTTWLEARKCGVERTKYRWKGPDREYRFTKTVELPGRGSHSSKECAAMSIDTDTYSHPKFDGLNADWMTPESLGAMIAHYKAADARIVAERKLIVSAIAVITSCTTYGQALDFWPEVEELEESMFGKVVIPPAFALVALTDEDKKALCANMASRGVAGAACERIAA